MCWYKELDTKFQTIWLISRQLLADPVTKVQPQFITFSTTLIRQTKVVSLDYSKQAANLQAIT